MGKVLLGELSCMQAGLISQLLSFCLAQRDKNLYQILLLCLILYFADVIGVICSF